MDVIDKAWLFLSLSYKSVEILLKEKKKNLVWKLTNLEYLVILSRFLLSWSIRRDSVHLELHARFLLRGKEKDSCLNFKANKNLFWSTKKNKNLERIDPRTSTSEILKNTSWRWRKSFNRCFRIKNIWPSCEIVFQCLAL